METQGEVLIADGDAAIRYLLTSIVRRLPRQAVAADDGPSALALLRSHTFDAVILDLILPELDGTDVLAFLERERPDMLPHVIVITTMPEKRWAGHAAMGAVGAVLSKPFALDELQNALRRCCNGAARVY
ncbi:MAG TPA: response regulator [Thermoanaerobaculia bacterium]|jgi:CheY-like chemotaxis protein